MAAGFFEYAPNHSAHLNFCFRFVFAVALFMAGAQSIALAGPGDFYPQGLTQDQLISGIAPGIDTGSCCWLGAHAAFKVTPPADADTLILTVFMPRYAVSGKDQSFRASISGEPIESRCCFGPGLHQLAFAIRKSANPRQIIVRLSMAHTFVPQLVGIGADTRHLSVLLHAVAFENVRTGARYDESSPFSNSPFARELTLGFLILAGLAIMLARRRPIYAVMALILSAPFAFSYGTHGTTITLSKTVLIGAAIGLLLHGVSSLRRPGRAFWLLFGAQALLVVSMLLSLVHAAYMPAAIRETLKGAEFLGVFLVAYLAYRADPDESLVRWTLAGVTLLVCALALTQEFTGAPESLWIAGHSVARIAGTLEGPNQLGAFLGVVLPCVLAFVLLRPSTRFERLTIGVGAVTTFLTFSRGGVGGLLLASALILALRYRPQYSRRIFVALGLLFVVLFGIACGAMSGVFPGAERIFGSSTDAYNGGLGTRAELWGGAYRLWRAHPILGVGPGNFEIDISRFAPGVRTHANSVYFQILAEQGIVGEIALFALVAASIIAFIKRRNEVLPLAGLAVAVAMAFHQIIDTLWIFPKIGVMWWIVLAVAAAADRSSEAERAAKSDERAVVPVGVIRRD